MALSQRMAGRSVADVLRSVVADAPDRTFLAHADRRITYAQIDEQSSALAAALHELGVGRADRIAIDLPNWPEFIVTLFAAAKLGAIVVPLNPRYTLNELQYMLRHSEAEVVVAVENFDGVDFLQVFEGLLATLPDLQYVLTVGDEDLWYDDRIYQFEDLISSGAGREVPVVEVDPLEDTFAIVYTSGTTGGLLVE